MGVAQGGVDGEARLRAYEKKKDEQEKEMASLKKQLAAFESRICCPNPDGDFHTTANAADANPNVLSRSSVLGGNYSHENRKLFRRNKLLHHDDEHGLHESTLYDANHAQVEESSLLTLTVSNAGNSIVASAQCKTRSGIAEGCDAQSKECPPAQDIYDGKETDALKVDRWDTSNLRMRGVQRPRTKRKRHRKLVKRCHQNLAVCGPPDTKSNVRRCLVLYTRRSARYIPSRQRKRWCRDLIRESCHKCSRKHFKTLVACSLNVPNVKTGNKPTLTYFVKRNKWKRKRRKKPRCRQKYLFPTFQETPFSPTTVEYRSKSGMRRKRHRCVFHSRGSCCPKRKRRRIIA